MVLVQKADEPSQTRAEHQLTTWMDFRVPLAWTRVWTGKQEVTEGSVVMTSPLELSLGCQTPLWEGL